MICPRCFFICRPVHGGALLTVPACLPHRHSSTGYIAGDIGCEDGHQASMDPLFIKVFTLPWQTGNLGVSDLI
jgi:hypothetical protein